MAYQVGLLELNHPFTPYRTLIKRNLENIYIRYYVPLCSGIQLAFFRDYFKLKEDRDCTKECNFEAPLPTDCCCGKALSVIYGEFVSVVLLIQHVIRMRHNILLSGLSCCNVFSHNI